jgi:hypothetical protein
MSADDRTVDDGSDFIELELQLVEDGSPMTFFAQFENRL